MLEVKSTTLDLSMRRTTIREDDFSSGEYMIVQIYKLMQKKCKLIVIDELDISAGQFCSGKFTQKF